MQQRPSDVTHIIVRRQHTHSTVVVSPAELLCVLSDRFRFLNPTTLSKEFGFEVASVQESVGDIACIWLVWGLLRTASPYYKDVVSVVHDKRTNSYLEYRPLKNINRDSLDTVIQANCTLDARWPPCYNSRLKRLLGGVHVCLLPSRGATGSG